VHLALLDGLLETGTGKRPVHSRAATSAPMPSKI